MRIIDGRDFDVIVAGAGCAGFCAAVQCGRGGLNTAVFEHFATPGGTLTVLGSNSIDQFNNPFRPVGDRMIISGIGWEYVNELARRGYAVIPDMDAPYRVHWQYGVKVNPVAAAQCMDDFLLEADVHLFYRQGIVAVETADTDRGTRVDAVIVSAKEGLIRHRARLFIDCSGDGDLCAWAGAAYQIGETLQPGTLRLYPGASDADYTALKAAEQTWLEETGRDASLSDILCCGLLEDFIRANGDNTNHIRGLNPVDGQLRTEAEIRARKDVMRLMNVLKESGVSVQAAAPETAARESRRILGDVVMTGEDYLNCRVYTDAVSCTYCFIDIHRAGQASEIVYMKNAATPTISLGAMRPSGLTNVFTAGRCISSDRACQSAIRVKASCMAMGQAAGAAAVVALRQGISDTRIVGAGSVRSYLASQGAIVPNA